MLSREEADRLIVEFWPKLPILVNEFSQFGRHIDDPLGVASVGLVVAGRTFDPSRCQFFTWVYRKVRSAMRDEFMKTKAENRDHSRAVPIGHYQPVFEEKSFAAVDARDEVKGILVGRTPLQLAAIQLYLEDKMERRQIGPALGATKEYVHYAIGALRRNPFIRRDS